MSKAPVVSVLIAAYEAAGFIETALESCQAQSGIDLEVIVIDDGSVESSQAVVQRFAAQDPRFKFIGLDKNGGPSAARNAGLEAATGTYIAILDSDDGFLPGRLKRLVAFAEMTGADIVADNMYATPDLSQTEDRTPFLYPSSVRDEPEIDLATYADPEADKRFGNPLGYLKPLMSRAFLERHGLNYDLSLTNSEDYYLIAHMLALGAKMRLHPEPGYLYLVRPGSISHRLNPSQTQAILDAEAGFSAQFSKTFSQATKTALQKRGSLLKHVHEYETLRADLLARQFLPFLKHLMANPVSAPGHLVKIAGIAMRRTR